MNKPNYGDLNTLIFKNIPKEINDLDCLLKSLHIPANQIKSFGRKRALVTYESSDVANGALEKLKQLEFAGKVPNVSVFSKEKLIKDKTAKVLEGSCKKASKSVQTQGIFIAEKDINNVPEHVNKQLGLIDTIYVDGNQSQSNASSTKSSKLKLMQQTYEYVIAMDFEATCWESQAPPRWRESEIIEFPAVLINLKTGKIEAEFHKYIMPIESPKLSSYCTQLTGITQKTVDSGIPLQTALMMFQEWLRKELRTRHLTLPKISKDNKVGNCAFVTWTDWDFGICLNKECTRKRLKKPPYFNQWIDMRAIYREWYKYKPLNFLDALTHVGIQFEGKQHSGIDDAKNLASLTYKLVSDGATLVITKDLTPFQLNLNCVF